MNNNKKELILKLRKEGKTYDEIKEIVKCSKSTISYHCGEGQKKKTLTRTNKCRNSVKGRIKQKIQNFKYKKIINKIRNARHLFHATSKENINVEDFNFTLNDVLEKIEENPQCYLTGEPIDLNNPDSFSFDHIIPKSKGGDNTLANLGLACKKANFAKSDLLLDDFILLCKSVLENHGYSVNKKEHPVK